MNQTREPLNEADLADLEAKRTWVRDHFTPESRDQYQTIAGKLRLIDTIVGAGWITPDETLKLQCLGITLGDAIAQQMGMSWIMVADQYGRDSALELPNTSILVFPQTMIAKRIERGESVVPSELFAQICEGVEDIRQDAK